MVDPAVLSLSFLAGMAMFFNPCGVALLPAYVSYLLGQKERREKNILQRALAGLRIGAVVSAGILSVFLTAGLLISLVGNFLAPYAIWLGVGTGVALVLLGAWMLFGKTVSIHLPHTLGTGDGFGRFYLFGVGYAIGGISCTLPAFLLVVFAALGGGGFFGGLLNFLAFSSGTVLLMLGVTTAAAVSKHAAERWIAARMRLVTRLTALVILGAGFYLIYFNIRAFLF